MDAIVSITEGHNKLLENVSKREKQEHFCSATLTAETLSKLNISIENLPTKSQQLLQQATSHTLGIECLDPVELSLRHSKKLSQNLQDNYEILKLKQKNKELQTKIDRNKKIIEGLRRDLVVAQGFLSSRKPNPENIQDHMRQLGQKIAAYSEGWENVKTKLSKLSVPEGLYPKSLDILVSQLATLKAEEMELKEKADDVKFSQEVRAKLKVY